MKNIVITLFNKHAIYSQRNIATRSRNHRWNEKETMRYVCSV
jgi:hypothetical protein